MFGFCLGTQHETMTGSIVTKDESVSNDVRSFNEMFKILETMFKPADTGQSQSRVDARFEHRITECHFNIGLSGQPSGAYYIAHMAIHVQHVASAGFYQPFLSGEVEVLARIDSRQSALTQKPEALQVIARNGIFRPVDWVSRVGESLKRENRFLGCPGLISINHDWKMIANYAT